MSSYLGGNKQQLHLQGLRFAINIDPAMFQVYSSSSASSFGKGWSVAVASNCLDPTVVSFSSGTFLSLCRMDTSNEVIALQGFYSAPAYNGL